jgi:ribosomal protein S18 acetylase RimI-like enzyme
MSTLYSFREANLNDLTLILNWTEALMEHESLGSNLELPLSSNISELLQAWLENLITDDHSLIIIATEIDQEQPLGLIIGYLQSQPNKFTDFQMHGIIQMVWVEENCRKKGLALQLVNHMEDTFQNLDIPYCEIQYSKSNIEASAFWKKAGYEVVSLRCRKILSTLS